MDDVAESTSTPSRKLPPFDTSLNASFNLRHGPRRAVVVEKIVAICPVGCHGRRDQRLPQNFFFFRQQVEHLLFNAPPLAAIARGKGIKREGAEHIVGLSQHEAPGEMGRVEVKDAIIKHPVLSAFKIANA